jgi:hypothetical protein
MFSGMTGSDENYTCDPHFLKEKLLAIWPDLYDEEEEPEDRDPPLSDKDRKSTNIWAI